MTPADVVEFMLAGVPNDGQNATLIMHRRMKILQDEPVQSPRQQSAYIDASTDLFEEEQAPSRKTCFTASYESASGSIELTNERLVFRTHQQGISSTLRRRSSGTNILLDVLLERIVRIDTITVHPVDAKSTFGLRLSVRQSGNTVAMHTLTDMDARDQAFNYIMALAPQRWQKQRPNFI